MLCHQPSLSHQHHDTLLVGTTEQMLVDTSLLLFLILLLILITETIQRVTFQTICMYTWNWYSWKDYIFGHFRRLNTLWEQSLINSVLTRVVHKETELFFYIFCFTYNLIKLVSFKVLPSTLDTPLATFFLQFWIVFCGMARRSQSNFLLAPLSSEIGDLSVGF